MDFTASWFEAAWLYTADFALILLLSLSAKNAWSVLQQKYRAAGFVFFWLALLWTLRAGIDSGQLSGMNYHLIGMSLATLMLGAPAAFWAGSLLMLPYTFINGGIGNIPVFALNTLLVILPPVILCHLMLWLTRRFLPPNLFIYIFTNGFIAAALGTLCTGGLVILTLSASKTFADVALWDTAFKVFFLIAWGEAFLTGILTAIFVALTPSMLATFEDARYLKKQAQIWK